MDVYRSKIVRFYGSWGSGIAELELSTGEMVSCENGPTVRALAAAYPDVIGPGHTVNVEALAGREIYWWLAEFGIVLGGFCPVELDETGELEQLAEETASRQPANDEEVQ